MVPTLDNILGSLVSWLPEQPLPDKETCNLISTVFSDLAEAHKHYATAARGLADIAGLVSPEQLTLVLTTAVPPHTAACPARDMGITIIGTSTTTQDDNNTGRQAGSDKLLQESNLAGSSG